MLTVCLLGKFDVKKNQTRIDIPSRPAQSLLAYLILNASGTHRREKLAGLLWPDSSERNARNNLRQALWRLGKSLGKSYFSADKASVGVNPGSTYWLDVDILRHGREDTAALIESVSVYEDRLLPGFYDEWILQEQEQLHLIYEDRVQQLLNRQAEQSCWQEMRRWAEHWIHRGTLSERPYQALMKAHAGLGDLAGMTAVCQRCSHALETGLGIGPSLETRDLFRHLGSEKRHPAEKYPQKKGKAFDTPVNLPHYPTPFMGRTDEIQLISTLLTDSANRLVTITGFGGMGKTRLAVEVARKLCSTFADGVYFVALAPIDDPVFMVSLIAETLGFSFHVRDQREQWDADLQIQQINGFLRHKHLLLVLDNTEHLITTAQRSMAEWKKGAETVISEILGSAPQVKILTTSRERLNLQGETLVTLEGLNFPKQSEPLEEIETYSAVRLFLKGAGQVQPGFALLTENARDVVEVCRRVDGVPLAIQLAAAWVELLSPREIVREIQKSLAFLETALADVPVRQRSMQSVFESTWQRLTPTEQKKFQKLSVFRGGFTIKAAQAVTGISLPVLRSLVNKSLVRPDTRGRHQIHELLRQFGLEQLAKFPGLETAAKDSHCAYFATVLETLEHDLAGQSQGSALAEIEVEIDNIRIAWKRAVTHCRFDWMEQIMESLCEFYRIRGELNEGFETFHPTAIALGWQGLSDSRTTPAQGRLFQEILETLDAAAHISTSPDRKKQIMGKVLARYARFHCESPNREASALQIRHSALEILSKTGDLHEMAWVLRYLAHAGLTPRETQTLYKKALALFTDFNDHRGSADILFRLGLTAAQMGEFQRAGQLYRDSLTKSRDLGSRQTVMFCLAELGLSQWALGLYSRATELCRESLPLSAEIGYPSFRATILRYLSRIRLSQGDAGAAGRLLEDAVTIYTGLGLKGMQAEALGEKARIAFVEKAYVKARQLARESIRMCRDRTHKRGLVVPLTILGEASLALNDLSTARSCLRTALKTALDLWMPSFALDALSGMIPLVAAAGKATPAKELAGFVAEHPGAWQWSRHRAELFLNTRGASEIRTGAMDFNDVVKNLDVLFGAQPSLSDLFV